MSGELWADGRLWWVLALAAGLPTAMVVLTEVAAALRRRGHPAVGPVLLLRSWVLPGAALLALLAFASRSEQDQVWARVVATFVGFLLILLLLSTLNVVVFATARRGTWRERIPTIFVEIARLLLVVVGLVFLFQIVWNADVGGLIAALGVTSIVLGLALQNAAGGVVLGLLLLFEQPFRLGDWLDTGDARGRLVEVNWRAVHIDTGSGVQVIPNAKLAAASFRNLSRPRGQSAATVAATFAPGDPPHTVLRLLRQLGEQLPARAPGRPVSVDYLGAGAYRVSVPVVSPAQAADAVGLYLGWLWYAARREGLALDAVAPDPVAGQALLDGVIDQLAVHLHLDAPARELVQGAAQVLRYGAGERIVAAGSVPESVLVVSEGTAQAVVPLAAGEKEAARIGEGEFLASAAVTRERAVTEVRAVDVVTVLSLPLTVVDQLVRQQPRFAADLDADLDLRRSQVRAIKAAARDQAVDGRSTAG